MTYIKLLTVLAGLALLTACAGGVNINNTNVPVNCETNAFHVDCNAIASAIKLRQDICLADATTSPLCTGEAGIVTVFCEADPFNAETACGHTDYDDDRVKIQTDCLAGTGEEGACERAVVVVCGANPYDRLCLAEEDYDAARMQIQNDCQSSATACTETTLANYCTANSFRRLCASADYDVVRTPLCIEDKITNDCTDTIARVCTDDPFATLCADESNYNTTRRTTCLTETTSVRCMPTVDRVCTANPYDDVCDGTTYVASRSLASARLEIASRNCATRALGDSRCAVLSIFVCTREPLEAVCDRLPEYGPARREECLKGDKTRPECVTTVRGVCTASVLDTLCDDNPIYASLQASECRDETATSKPECATTLTRVCGNLAGTSQTGDPFDSTCGNAVFQDARDAVELACVTVTNGRLCQAVRDNTCATTPFDPVCAGDNKYLPLQIRACIGQAATGNCVSEAFFANSVIRSCLADPSATACTASNSAFKPYETIALDATCFLAGNGARAGCVNPTAVFATLPSEPTEVLNTHTSPVFASRSGFLALEASNIDTMTDTLDLSTFTIVSGQFAKSPSATYLLNVIIRRGGAGSDNDDGVAYFNTADNEDTNAFAYGGILPTTNLGAPLDVRPAVAGKNVTAIWDGHLSYQETVSNAPRSFWVDFTAGTIGFTNTTNDGAGTHRVRSTGFIDLTLHGTFGPNAKLVSGEVATPTRTAITLAPGQLGGSVYFAIGTISGDNESTVRSGYHELHGLIGQEGVVGVFTNTGNLASNSHIGGFTASNPDHPNNQ